jgi:hypothetical protein
MTFVAPLWLFALVPWTGVVLYLLWGRRTRVYVPFLELWPAHGEGVRVRRRAAPPPVALALAILSTLLALVAAARPALRTPAGGPMVTVILDRGYTMSTREAQSTRAGTLLGEVTAVVRKGSADRENFERVIVPARQGAASSSLAGFGAPTALDTHELIDPAVRNARRDAPANVILVLTDQPSSVQDDRVIRVSPTTVVRNARIVAIAARETPAAQVMVRVRGGPGFGAAKLRVTSGAQRAERDVQLPEIGERDEFIDFEKLGPSVRADLLVDDEQLADNTAWLAREASWPRIESRVPLPAHLQRMVDVYAKQRPAGEASKRIAIVSSVGDLPADAPGVVLPRLSEAAGNDPAAQPVIADHAVTKGVTFADAGRPALASDAPPPGWTPLVSVNGKVWVAAREGPARAVWVGFDTSDWARSPAFVVFWANVLNWVGAAGDRFASYPVGSLDDADWKPVELAALPPGTELPEPKLWPGLYQRSDGTVRALNAPDVPIPPPPPATADWRQRLAAVDKQARQVDLAPTLAAAALVCLALAAWTWKRKEPLRQVMA